MLLLQSPRISRLSPLLFALLLSGITSAQSTVTGQVTDDTGTSLFGVNVLIKGTSRGTQTGGEGEYSLTDVPDTATLVFSYLGFDSREVRVNGQSRVDVTLGTNAEQLDEVVVVAYGTVKKSDLTGAVSSIGEKDFNQGVNVSLDQMIAGRAAGVNITQTSAEPGGGVSVRIRGSSSITAGNDPLYVIDGLPIQNSPNVIGTGAGVAGNSSVRNPLASLNPNDIESVEILKDASAAALYGSRGANGVIIITTKKGRSGRGVVSYDAQFGLQNVANYVDLLDAREFATVVNDINAEQGDDPLYDLGAIGAGTDYLDVITRQGKMQSHNLGFSGGSETTTFSVSLNYFDQEGVVISSGVKRYVGRVNLTNEFSDKFRIGLNLNSSLVEDDYVSYGNGGNNDILYTALQTDPTIPLYNPDGTLLQTDEIDFSNVLSIADIYSVNKTNRTFGNIYGEYDLLSNLRFKLNLGTDHVGGRRDSYNPTTTKSGLNNGGIGGIISNEKDNYLLEATLNYNRTLGTDHSIDVLAGYTYQYFVNQGFTGSITGFPSDVTLSNNLGLGDTELDNIGSFKNDNTLLSYLGRVNYSAYNKYLLTASFRVDGSSRFGTNNKYGVFPSFAAAWKIAQEDFLKDSRSISDLKLRASWGKNGNQEIGNYNSLTLLSGGGQAVFNEQLVQGINAAGIPNPDLRWETTTQLDIGVDLGLWQNRLTASVDYFRKNTDDLLLNLPIPRTSGFFTILTNIGSVENRGFEFVLSTRNVVGDRFTWRTDLNFTTLENEVTDIGPLDEIIRGNLPFTQGISVIRVGSPIGSYFGTIVDGIFQEGDDIAESAQPKAQPGYPRFRDINADGTIDAADRTIIGNPFPDYTFGVSNSFTYGDLSLDVFLTGEMGAEILSQNLLESLYPIDVRRNRLAEPLLNRWTPTNTNTVWPSGVNPSSYGGSPINTLTIEDASFVRLRNVRLSYAIPTENIRALSGLTVYLAGQNLVTWTDYSGFDPEVNTFGNSDVRADYNAYPTARTFLAGLNVTF